MRAPPGSTSRVLAARRSAPADTAWANVVAARLRVGAGERAVAAAERALAGVKAEYAVALRTTLDILIADESLRGAQLSLAGSRADLLSGGSGAAPRDGLADRRRVRVTDASGNPNHGPRV